MHQKLKYQGLLLILVLISVPVSAQVSKTDIDKAIDIPSLKHPYLYFSDKEKPELINRIKIDQECNDIFRKLEAQAKMWLAMPVERNIPVQGKNTRAGWSEQDRDGKYSRYYSNNVDNAYYLSFLYQMTGDRKYADKAFDFADAFCDLTTWTQRAHEFPVIYSRIMPWNVPDDQVNFNFDHYNGDAARMMAAVYDWLYPALNQAQRDRIRGALLEKVVTRVRGNYEFHWWATAYRCNWCGVCNSGIGLTGLALLTENPQLTDIVAESYNRINSMFNELGEDGGWQEGGGYWNYGVFTSTFFADALKRMTGAKYNLFENERLKNNPATFPLYISLPGNKSISFEDSGGGSLIGSTYLINKLASETKNREAAWYSSEFFGIRNNIFDIIWPESDIKPAAPINPSKHFRTIDWWVLRSDFKDPAKVLVAGKAGMNNDPHHGHFDIGHFIIYWQNDYFIEDMGNQGGYDEKYFDDARWDYPNASSIGHNVIFVNNEKQIPGKMRKQPWNYEVGGKVLEFKTSVNRDYVLMDPSKAYPGNELKGWRRHIIFEKPEITLILDEIKSAPGAGIEIRFHPGVSFDIKEKYAILDNGKGKMALIPVAVQDFNIIPGKHATQFINATKAFFWIDYFDTELKAKNEKTFVATVILPVESSEEASQIADSRQMKLEKSGNLSVSFKTKGISHSVEFTPSTDGYRLSN
ncbi:MAG TPA: heparinase II/III family protein [Bacteroidales bacterium]|nr:heparinase II/III family protein [Bacteroidales bacterium]